MPRRPRCVPCLSDQAKELLRQGATDPVMRQAIDAVGTCAGGEYLNLCGEQKRPRSQYQTFISECLKAKRLTRFDPEAMKDCARTWRERKGN